MSKNRAFSETKKQRGGCGTTEPNVLCNSDTCDWFINQPEFFNCFLVYVHYIHDTSHTLQEVAALMNISHTTVKQIETQALNKLRETAQSGELSPKDMQRILKIVK